LFAQTNRYTKGAENGYAWQEMDNPILMFNTSKETYLSSILQRYSLMQDRYPELESLSCREDINRLLKKGKSDEISLDDVVKKIDKFYSRSDNVVIPIIFVYCYCIKELAGASVDELNNYKEEVLLFCNE
jgi:hypothetical protein